MQRAGVWVPWWGTYPQSRTCVSSPCALSLHCSFLMRPGNRGSAPSAWLPSLLAGSVVTFGFVNSRVLLALTEIWRSPLKSSFVPDAPIPLPSPQCLRWAAQPSICQFSRRGRRARGARQESRRRDSRSWQPRGCGFLSLLKYFEKPPPVVWKVLVSIL